MSDKFEIILVGPYGCGKTRLANELKAILLKYGVKRVTSIRYIPDGGDWGDEILEWEADAP